MAAGALGCGGQELGAHACDKHENEVVEVDKSEAEGFVDDGQPWLKAVNNLFINN